MKIEKMKKLVEHKEEKEMTVTIIGSLQRRGRMKMIGKYFERKGHTVYVPTETHLSLVEIQIEQIRKIKQADIIIAVPKSFEAEANGSGKMSYVFGESTSYEMAIANEFNKPVFIAG